MNTTTHPPLSKEQTEIIQAVKTKSQTSLCIDSCAGAAKTTTLVHVANAIAPERTLALAFNKSIATELAQRMPPSVSVSTINALGHRAVGDFLGKRAQVKDNKVWAYWREHSAYFLTLDPDEQKDIVKAYCQVKGKGAGFTSPKHLPKFTPATNSCPSDIFVASLIEEGLHELDFAELLSSLEEVWLADITESFQGTIQFLDQIYLPACFESIGLTPYPNVLVDEAQDLSPLDHKILKRLVSKYPAGRLIAFGDRGQAIYGFRGADYNSFETLQKLFSAESLSLPVSFRCPKAVVAEASKIDPRIQPWENAIEGKVSSFPYNWEPVFPANSVVLCRNNAPLFKLAVEAVKARQGVAFLGRDIEKTLLKYLARHSKGINSLSGLWDSLALAEAKIESKSLKARHKDYTQCFAAIADWKQATMPEHIAQGLQELFAQVGSLQLCTVHRSKGLEWQNVFLLRPDLIPSEYAHSPEELQQEANLMYVAITRAQHSFTYLTQG